MIVLDEPYASEPLLAWMESSQHPVLDNEFARTTAAGRALNLVSADEAVRRIDAGERVYTNSENALAWIVENAHNESLSRAIGLFKDKAAMRQVLAALDPDLFFKTCSVDELFKLVQANPGISFEVDLEAQVVKAGDKTYSFKIDDFRRHCMLNGLDSIGLTLQHEEAISAYERQQPAFMN